MNLKGSAIASEPPKATIAQQFSTDTKSHPEVVATPYDWAIQSLQDLAKRYECTTDLNQPMQPHDSQSRYELVAELNACFHRINNRFATQQDRDIAQTLQQEFKTELTAIQARATELEVQTAALQSHQFSPTSKLQGQTIITIQGGGF